MTDSETTKADEETSRLTAAIAEWLEAPAPLQNDVLAVLADREQSELREASRNQEAKPASALASAKSAKAFLVARRLLEVLRE